MCVSLISRHIIMSYFHHVNFILHDVLIPFFILSLGIQFLPVNRLHVYNGILLCLFIIPIFFINGMLLSFFISNQSYSYLFKNYGFHFILSGMELFETGFYNRFPKYLYYLHIYLMFSNIYVDLYLLTNMTQSKFSLDFFVCLFPLLFINFLNVQSYKKKNVRSHHILNAYILTYLSMLGIFFSTSIDSHWIFKKTQPLLIRMFIQNIPLSIFLFNLPKLY
jgi:hypothetical protein